METTFHSVCGNDTRHVSQTQANPFICDNVYHFFKLVFEVEVSTFYEPTSQYDDLNILLKCLFLLDWSYIIIAQWSKALVCRTTDPEILSTGDNVKIF